MESACLGTPDKVISRETELPLETIQGLVHRLLKRHNVRTRGGLAKAFRYLKPCTESEIVAWVELIPKHRTCAKLLAECKSNKEIGLILGIPDVAVSQVNFRMFAKFACHNRTQFGNKVRYLLALEEERDRYAKG
jgi:DNA-binding NarL/FixJ family response regulator